MDSFSATATVVTDAIYPSTAADDREYVFNVTPMSARWKLAIQGKALTEDGKVLRGPLAVNKATNTTVWITFCDAGGKRWKRSTAGDVERLVS